VRRVGIKFHNNRTNYHRKTTKRVAANCIYPLSVHCTHSSDFTLSLVLAWEEREKDALKENYLEPAISNYRISIILIAQGSRLKGKGSCCKFAPTLHTNREIMCFLCARWCFPLKCPSRRDQDNTTFHSGDTHDYCLFLVIAALCAHADAIQRLSIFFEKCVCVCPQHKARTPHLI